jgi:hypothetical protein
LNLPANGLVAGTNQLVLSGGNVGIGTTSPIWKFTVAGGGTSSLFTTTDYAPGTTGSAIGITPSAGTGNTYGLIQVYNSGGAATNSLALQPSGGNVGIGTTSPLTKLHLYKGLDSAGPVTYTASVSAEGLLLNHYTNTSDGYRRYGDIVSFGNQDGANGGGVIRFLTNSQASYTVVEQMRIDRNGNVGIGTTSPGGALQVNGTTILGGALSTSGGDFSFMDAGVADSTAVRLMSNGGNLFLQNGSGGNTYFRNKTAATVMTVQNGGNVGIGTTSPAAALEVNGGFIRAIAHASGTGAQSNTAPAQIAGRTLTFTKSKSSTSIRIGWTDGVRVGFGTDNTACRYEIKVDGSSCSGGAMVYEFYMGGAAYIDHHRPQTLVGYCDGLGVGSHTLTLWVGPVPGWTQGSCYTGWNSVRWVLEAEEVN